MLKALQRGALPTRLTSSMWHRMALRGGARQPYNRRRARGRRPHSRVQRGRVPGVHGCPRHRIRPARRAHRVRGGCGRWPGRPPPSLPTTSPCSTATRSAWTFRGACSGHPCRSSSVPLKLLATLFRTRQYAISHSYDCSAPCSAVPSKSRAWTLRPPPPRAAPPRRGSPRPRRSHHPLTMKSIVEDKPNFLPFQYANFKILNKMSHSLTLILIFYISC